VQLPAVRRQLAAFACAIEDDLVNAGPKFVDSPAWCYGGVRSRIRPPRLPPRRGYHHLTPFCRTIIDVWRQEHRRRRRKRKKPHSSVPAAAITAVAAGGLSEEEARLVGQRNNFDLVTSTPQL